MQTRMAWPPVTKNLKITLVALAVLWLLAFEITAFVEEHMLVSAAAVLEGKVWTVFTYALWHMEFSHLMFNGLALWMFGGELDRRWDDLWFWGFCALCAIGGGLTIVASQLLLGASQPTLGYSGAVMGLVAAFCWHNWNRPLSMFVVRLPGKWLLAFFVAIDVLLVVGAQQPISIAGHLGGMATGLLLVGGYWRPRRLKTAYKRWKLSRGGGGQSRSPDRKTPNGHWIN